MIKGWKGLFALGIKLALLVALYWILFNVVLAKIDFKSVLQRAIEADRFYLTIATVLFYLKFAIGAYRFKVTSSFYSIQVPFTKYFLNEYKMLFLKILFPVPATEDFFRILFLRLQQIKIHQCLNSIITLRITWVLSLLLLVSFLMFRSGAVLIESSGPFIVTAAIAFLIFLIFFRVWLQVLAKYIKKPVWLLELIRNILAVKMTQRLVLSVTVISLVQHLFSALAIYFIFISLDAQFSLPIILSIVPIMVLSFIIPISVQGIGVPEAALLFLLLKFNVPEDVASATCIIHLGLYISVILAGGGLLLIDKDYRLSTIRTEIKQGIELIKSTVFS